MFAYLDNSATTKPYDEVIEAMTHTMTIDYGNPSSLHKLGMKGEKIIKESRKQVAKLIGADPAEVYFTSGGTESNNLAILGAVSGMKKRGNHIITTAIEHPAVLNPVRHLEEQGFEATYLPVDEKGFINVEDFKSALRDDTILVCIMHVNNEVGSIQPIQAISNILKSAKSKAHLHVDGIQAVGKLDVSVRRLGCDSYSISGHKIHGPKGIGALYIKKGSTIKPLVYGGGQENSMRPGTENVSGIAGLGKAAELTVANLKDNRLKLNEMRAFFHEGLKEGVDKIRFNSELDEGYAPHILNVSFPGMRGEVLLHTLEMKDVYVSTGSACASQNKSYSHVLTAMGLSNVEMEGAIRFSFTAEIKQEQLDYALDVVKSSIKDLDMIIKGR